MDRYARTQSYSLSVARDGPLYIDSELLIVSSERWTVMQGLRVTHCQWREMGRYTETQSYSLSVARDVLFYPVMVFSSSRCATESNTPTHYRFADSNWALSRARSPLGVFYDASVLGLASYRALSFESRSIITWSLSWDWPPTVSFCMSPALSELSLLVGLGLLPVLLFESRYIITKSLIWAWLPTVSFCLSRTISRLIFLLVSRYR